MKKYLLIIVLFLLSSFSFSQNIFSDGFETGNTDGSTTVNGWTQAVGPNYTSYNWTANSTQTSYNRTPRTGTWDCYLHYSGEAWLFKQVTLTGGTGYVFSVYARQDGSTTTNATIELKYGTTATIAGMTNSITSAIGIGSSYQQIKGVLTPSTSGTYYVAIHGWINGSPWYITIDDVSLDLGVAPTAPPTA
ncbi:MAG TPA: hypothetical protein PKN44_15565, partial [Bacteroidales bacterium]|nr:hypothetical protein [Bacteroidales bacterium]